MTDAIPELSEKQWQAFVERWAKDLGWEHYHTHRSKGSDPGWPDLVLCRPPQIIFVELKSAKGKLTDAQKEWLERLRLCGLSTFVWRPADEREVFCILTSTVVGIGQKAELP